MDARPADLADLDGLTSVLTEAFAADPLWSWAFPGGDGLERWWRFLIRGALRYPTVRIMGDYAAAAVFIPPGGTELTPEDEGRVERLLHDLVGDRATAVLGLLDRFETARPDEPHHYLTLLGTADRYRGRGLGMTLLAQCLQDIDDEGLPAYLESSNPANDARYEARGFRRIGEFTRPDEGHTVARMWRDAA